jgi:hypothetical protein
MLSAAPHPPDAGKASALPDGDQERSESVPFEARYHAEHAAGPAEDDDARVAAS